ncbi:complement factor H-like isoform X5 [Rana temporaria]|uniref:complement factor H-like isoform X5 n=1 Tax=Rana temporaria TaxID=8407 RepID=UPI001AAD55B0|nr:complement factor H-like isoform X5 [Rana temporaria]
MKLLGCLLVLTGVVCCTAAPASDTEKPPDSCGTPPRFLDRELQGDWNKELYNSGEFVQYSCRPGFSRLGPIRYVCSKGKWENASTGQCKKKSCGHPGDIEFGTFELKKEDSFVFGALVEYICNDGYQMISRHRTRECSATGWTNYRPECEVRFCPPVQVSNNVNLLTTSYEEEYSVGQVIRFECKNANQKLNGASEVFCTSEGEWNAEPPTCEEVKCSPPKIIHGTVRNPKPTYKDRETLEFSCEQGYKTSTSNQLTCTKNDWSPTPICEDIVCYKETVRNGIVQYNKETYIDGETVTLTCNEGYQIEHTPEKPRTCTAHGWSPPLNCIRKKCSQPNPQNGYIEDRYNFPISPDAYYNSIYYHCNSGYLSKDRKNYWGETTCTKTGWNPEPKCSKKCDVPSSDSINANFQHSWPQIYIEGDKLRFQCYRDHKTSNGQTTGEIECLPDGKFSAEKCSKSCQKPNLANMKYKPNENVFEVGAYFIYKCKEGFISRDNKVEGVSQCGNDGWQPYPECRDGTIESLPTLYLTKRKESKCPSIAEPSNARVINPKTEYFNGDEIEIECDTGYQMYGSEKGLCKDGKWQSPPWCTEKKRCTRNPPQIPNGEISEESVADQYYSGSTVKYRCADGYRIIGSDESKCIDGKWLPLPTCEGNSCGKPREILNGRAEDKVYKHRERASYICNKGYKLSQAEPASCDLGKWKDIPQCIDSSCGLPPKMTNGRLKEAQKAKYLSGERATYECYGGYTMRQNANYITCENSEWTELPVCRIIGQTCGAPPVVQFGDITEIKQKTYQSGSSVIYKCANFYKLEGQQKITCRDGEWEKEPVCREIGQTCGPPPVVQFGDITEIKQKTYQSGSSVIYKCANFYKLDGEQEITCWGGEWEKEPVCRVPCTVKETDLQQNNIQFKFKYGEEKNKKLYSEHADHVTFECKPGYKISDTSLLRIQCLEGVLKYSRCLKEGTCVLQQREMSINNIHYNKSTEIENGQTIEFECEEGMLSENLRATCKNKQIKYPKCSAGRSCPPPDISNAILSPKKQDGYESGSSANFKCENTFVLSGNINVKCENGKWDELPQCLKPCTIDSSSLERNHIEFVPTERTPEILEHGTDLNLKCKANFKRQGSLIASCYDGAMKYPRCFSGGTCRIIQMDLDDNFLELDERHENEVFYEEGETVRFTCKTGYRNRDGLTGTCTKSEAKQPAEYTLTYPTCTQESAV